MSPISFMRHRFPPDVIRHAVWFYFWFTLSLRDVEEMLAERDIDASYEAIRDWTRKFGKAFATNLRKSRARSSGRWHLDEMVVKIAGERMYLWRAVDDEGQVLDMLVQQRLKSQTSAQRLLATHAAVNNTFNLQRHLIRRPPLRLFRVEADRAWTAATAAA